MDWILAIPALPTLSFALLLVMSRQVRMRMLWLPVASIFGSLILSIVAFAQVWPGGSEEAIWHAGWEFAELAGKPVDLSVALDPVAAVMLLVVTIVGAAVQVYSLGYMHREEREGWYFAVLSLFTAAMLMLVLSDSLLLTFMMWEMMGLCSYLLIGFWFENEGPRKASQKAFLTTRVGDLGFLIALFAIWGVVGSFSYEEVLHTVGDWPAAVAAVAGFGLLWAAMGKSAQVPLQVWLPDAMAGPTPASALIHAATMVAAGVYVVARMLPVLMVTPWIMQTTLVVGLTTALLGGLLAAVQHDVKKVLAYSTISQLGLMFVALGAANAEVALFHLTTHAFFKSLLFLGAGVIIHAAHTQDMRFMGGLRRHMPITTVTFTIGSLALAAVFPLSGFFSKDEIVATLLHEHHYVSAGVVLLASLVTAFYVARMLFRVFTGPEQTKHLSEGHMSMLAPMSVLAFITLVLGFASPTFANFLGGHGVWPDPFVAAISMTSAGAGLALGWWFYGRRSAVVNTAIWKRRLGYAYDALAQKLYFDAVYDHVFIRPFMLGATLLAVFDMRRLDGFVNLVAATWVRICTISWRVDVTAIDGVVNGVASAAKGTGSWMRGLQNGVIQRYQRLVLGAVIVLVLVVFMVKGV
ncbi:MAG: NADH-quinone oxidoreductase subunit L [Coriobacteriales bacterium]|nr:NADH-quinone oxidoreductase subunit L [Coriobacteriales bacterium]